MVINENLLMRLEKLSMLQIEGVKRQEILSQLSEIISFVENLGELDTANLDAQFSTLEGGTPLREDSPHCDKQIPASVLGFAPKSGENFFIVPKIIE